jgi:hypothetical protein
MQLIIAEENSCQYLLKLKTYCRLRRSQSSEKRKFKDQTKGKSLEFWEKADPENNPDACVARDRIILKTSQAK